jgi:hypothetical protein
MAGRTTKSNVPEEPLRWSVERAAHALFIPAWTIAYWQAWLFLVVFFTPGLVITIYLMKKDPKLLERRITVGPTDEKETSQRIIVISFVTGRSFVAEFRR